MNDRCSRGIKMQQVQQKYNEVKGFSSRYDDITDTEKHDRKLNMNERFGAANLRDHKSKSVTTKWGKISLSVWHNEPTPQHAGEK